MHACMHTFKACAQGCVLPRVRVYVRVCLCLCMRVDGCEWVGRMAWLCARVWVCSSSIKHRKHVEEHISFSDSCA